MSETATQEAPVTNENVHQTSSDVLAKYAESISKKREAVKSEESKAEPIVENTEIIAEVPKEVISNGQSKDPVKEVVAAPVEAPVETDWRKELGFDDSAEIKQEENKPVISKDFRAEYDEATKELEEINNDPLIAAYKAAKKSGKDVSSFLNEIRGVDVNRLTPDQIWEASLNAEEGLSAEDKAISLEKFAELDKFEKIQKTKTFKQELIAQQAENLKKYASDTSASAKDKESQAKALAVMAKEQGKQFFDKIKDKEWQGLKMTSSEINKLENYLANDFRLMNADGSINYEMYAKVGNYALNERTILQNTYKKGETKGYEKALLEIARPSSNEKRFNSAPDIKTNNKSERAKEAQKAAFNPA